MIGIAIMSIHISSTRLCVALISVNVYPNPAIAAYNNVLLISTDSISLLENMANNLSWLTTKYNTTFITADARIATIFVMLILVKFWATWLLIDIWVYKLQHATAAILNIWPKIANTKIWYNINFIASASV